MNENSLCRRYPSLGPISFPDKWNLPSATNMLRNSITRLSMHGRWWLNDPDCIILRTSTVFTQDEIIGIAVVKALSGGPLIISDSLSAVPEDRMHIAKQLIPPTGTSFEDRVLSITIILFLTACSENRFSSSGFGSSR